MTVYNINLGIGWASSGVEYAQAYRSTIFKNTGIKAKFVFMDMFLQDNLSKTQVLRPNLSLWICSCRTIFLI